MQETGRWKPRNFVNRKAIWSTKWNVLKHHVSLVYHSHIQSNYISTFGCAGKSQGQPHSYSHERLKEQVGVVEAGMYWDMRREYTAMEAEKENAMSEFERMKQEV